jgi:uncharacterized protein
LSTTATDAFVTGAFPRSLRPSLARRALSTYAATSATIGKHVTVRDNPTELRYELHADGVLAGVLRYRRQPGGLVLVVTDLEPQFEGQGLGARLVQGALDDARARGLRVVPLCPLVSDFIAHHPDYADLVTSDAALPE